MVDPNKLTGRELVLISNMLVLQEQINVALALVKAYENPKSATNFMVSEQQYRAAKATVEQNKITIREKLRGKRKPVVDAFKRAKAALPK